MPIDLTTLVSPEAGEIACDINDGNKLKRYDSISATWTELGSGAGGINYISANSDFEAGTTGYAAYADAAATSPVDATGGSPNITITASASSPLRGVQSGLITKDAANRQGQGVSYDLTIDAADKAQIQRISFDYESSANYVDGDIRVYVYDVTNSRLIEVVDRDLFASSFGKYTGTFQTSSDSTSYRLIWHVASVNASAWTVKLDNVVVGPQNLIKGAIVTDWEEYTPTISGLGAGSTTLLNGFWRRVGDSVEIQVSFTKDGTPGSGATAVTSSIPSGLSVDTAKFITGSTVDYTTMGTFRIRRGGSGVNEDGSVFVGATSFIVFRENGATTSLEGADFTANTSFAVNAFIPILGWSSNMTLSEDAGNREIVARATTSNITLTTTPAIIPLNTTLKDTTASINLASDSYTFPESGEYEIIAQLRYNADATPTRRIDFQPRLDGATQTNWFVATSNSLDTRVFTYTLEAVKGQVFTIFGAINTGTLDAGVGFVTIAKRSSPQTVAASEIVAARYTSNSGQSIPASETVMVMEARVLDTHGSYNTSTGQYTIPQSGYYLIHFRAWTASFVPSSEISAFTISIRIGGGRRGYNVTRSGTTSATTLGCEATVNGIFISKGSVVTVECLCSNVTTMNTSGGTNEYSITKINGVS